MSHEELWVTPGMTSEQMLDCVTKKLSTQPESTKEEDSEKKQVNYNEVAKEWSQNLQDKFANKNSMHALYMKAIYNCSVQVDVLHLASHFLMMSVTDEAILQECRKTHTRLGFDQYPHDARCVQLGELAKRSRTSRTFVNDMV
jgi:hypothetical protein